MLRRVSILAFAAALVSSAGCSKEDEASSPGTPVIAALPATVTADGVDTMTLTVTGASAPYALATSRGRFQNGDTSAQIATAGGIATLRPCDARVDPTCAGPTVVTAASADGGVAQIVVQFEGFERCANGVDDNEDGLKDCADPQCPLDSPCGSNGLLCSATSQCNKCTGNGGAAQPAGETSCTDGFDNDCDGMRDCLDPDCSAQTCTTTTGSSGVCKSGACACDKTQELESSCGDGRDNDCDGLVDCLDADCLGDVCNATRGLLCSGGASPSCSVCPTGQASETPAQCGDGKDNDCDGQVDCADADCQPDATAGTPGETCNPFGGRCILTSGIPSCGCPGGATTELTCDDGVDDDCDGHDDCEDPDCQPAASGMVGVACDTLGRSCTSGGACACPGAAELCNNYDQAGLPIDDDCDGDANCEDRDCRPTVPGGRGADCSNPDQYGMACTSGGACGCTGNGAPPEASEVTCDDGLDNDCDFLVDCEDPDCSAGTARACGAYGGICSAATLSCVCPGGATTETSCTNGLDDDCNGKVDCEEAACAGQACSAVPALAAYTCISGACADPVTQYGVAVTPVRPRIPANGTATTAIDVVVTYRGMTRGGETVTFAVSDPTLGAVAPVSVLTDSQGRAQVTYTAAAKVGVQTLTATVTSVGAEGVATVQQPAIGEIRLRAGGILHEVMGVKTSGFQEQNQLVVEVLDADGEAYPDGLAVLFEHPPLGGSTLGDALAAPSCTVSPCVQSLGETASSGLAQVRLHSGTVAGVVGITATATAGGLSRSFELPRIPVVGAKANAGHFSVVCGPSNVPALAGTTCHVSDVDAPFTCVALLKDRYGNLLGRATPVSFLSEAGAVGSPARTPAYDPASDPASQADLGTALQIVNTLGAKLPKDVPPLVGEESVVTAADSCGITTRNPRDGVVTVVAWTPGEEAFFDANGNGRYDAAEPFVDLPEPFVDYDDDDVRDADEPFVDTNVDGDWDGPNGAWDASANVWTKTVLVYSGLPAFLRLAGEDYLSRWMETADAGQYAAPTPAAAFAIRPAFPVEDYTDWNKNGRYDASVSEPFTDEAEPFVDTDADGVYDAAEPFTDTNANGVHDGGEPFTDTDADGVYDVAEPFTDRNGSGAWNGLNGVYEVGEPFTDWNGNGTRSTNIPEPFVDLDGDLTYDDKKTPATSESLVVTASDRNLNRLDAATTYAVTLPATAKFKADYHGLDGLPDRRGLGFGFQPCLATAPASCALDCADISTPLAPACVMRTRVSDFSYGYTASVTLTGGPEGSAEGATSAFWNISLLGETLQIAVPGTHQ